MMTPRRVRGKSRASIELIAAAAEILREIQPATVRAVCCRLFVAGLIPSMDKIGISDHFRAYRARRCPRGCYSIPLPGDTLGGAR